jgi:hypothetical protein
VGNQDAGDRKDIYLREVCNVSPNRNLVETDKSGLKNLVEIDKTYNSYDKKATVTEDYSITESFWS